MRAGNLEPEISRPVEMPNSAAEQGVDAIVEPSQRNEDADSEHRSRKRVAEAGYAHGGAREAVRSHATGICEQQAEGDSDEGSYGGTESGYSRPLCRKPSLERDVGMVNGVVDEAWRTASTKPATKGQRTQERRRGSLSNP